MKALLIAAGRRVSLAQRFVAHGFEVYAYETEVNCPIASIGTVIEGVRWADPNIRQHIVDIINEIKPNLVLPLSDHATPILSSIPYTGVITASGRTNAICLDKRKFEKQLRARPFYPNVEEDRPVIIKPIFGANSKGIQKLSYTDYLSHKEEYVNTHVAQKLVEGFEISVDAYFNKYSKMIDAVPRKRIEVQGGEVSRSITLPRESYQVVELTRIVGEEIGLLGPVCAQYIIGDNQPFIMEINARFGGGVILSLEAGFDQIQLLKEEWVEGKPCLPRHHDWEVGFGMTRYFQEYFYGGIDG
ncbi:MAG TPA: ATP-grasp domain-containing protein [Candidatus Saccharimonadia bacterium]|nr:ATP-grasp domain-containing protein [Candidatus Saccharimonadia bacterium]